MAGRSLGCRIPNRAAPLTEEQETARRLRLAELDRVAARLEAGDPGGAARAAILLRSITSSS
jgi:hypothetical protein